MTIFHSLDKYTPKEGITFSEIFYLKKKKQKTIHFSLTRFHDLFLLAVAFKTLAVHRKYSQYIMLPWL